MVVQGLKTFYAPAKRLDMDSIRGMKNIAVGNRKPKYNI